MAVREIIQLGEKGGDLILKTFQRINTQKEKFIKPATAKLATMYDKGKEPTKKPETESEKSSALIREKAKGAADELNNLAHSAASLDPTRFTSGMIDAVGNMTSKFANSIPLIGNMLGAAAGYAAETAKMASGMASNSLSLIKNSQGVAIDTMEKKGRMQFYGGETIQNKGYSLAEKSGIIETVAAKFGKIGGTNLEKSINKLFAANPDIQQATDLAAGNYRALGTDKGYFLQQIADSLGNLPPSMSQEVQSQLLQTIKPEELNKDIAAGYRQTRATFDNQDRDTQKTIAGMTENSSKLNESLNQLSVNLASGGSKLVSSIDTLTKNINFVMSRLMNNQGVKAK